MCINDDVCVGLEKFGVEVVLFENEYFGEYYFYGNKIEGLFVLFEGELFIFFDIDMLIIGELMDFDIDFDKLVVLMCCEGIWLEEEFYWFGYIVIWKFFYDWFDFDFVSLFDFSKFDEYWECYLYFNVGWFFYKDFVVFCEWFL